MHPSRNIHHDSAKLFEASLWLCRSSAALALSLVLTCALFAADGQKSTSENTVHVTLPMPVAPQKFPVPLKFFIADVTDRSGNPQPLLLFGGRGGIFMDRLPDATIREALERSLRSSDLLATDAESADLVLSVYLFHFGLAQSFGDFYGKVEFAVMLKDPKTGKSQQVSASGTSIAGSAIRKKSIQANVEETVENALSDAVRNLLRGQALHDAIAAMTSAAPAASSASSPSAAENDSAAKP